jgi:TRAP-type C4-dicarboxylate transport system substrate-binding protein
MKRVAFILLALALALSFGITGCTEEAEPEPEVVVLDFYTMYNPDYIYTEDFYPTVFGQIEDESNEEIQIEIHWAQELGPTTEAHTIIGTGVADFGHVFAPFYPEQLPLTNLAGLPLTADDPRQAQDALMACLADPTVGGDLAAEWEAMNLVPIMLFPFVMPATLWGKGANVTTVEELAGRKILMTGEMPANQVLEAFDATVVVRTMHEAYESLQTGLVDSIFVVTTSVPSYSLHEQLDWGVDNTGFFLYPMTIQFNKDSWEALSTEHQDIIWNAFWENRAMMCEAGLDGWAEALLTIKDWGIDIYSWSEEEVSQFKTAATPIWEDYITNWDCEEFAAAFVTNLRIEGAEPPWSP